jgi:hypothetical protein
VNHFKNKILNFGSRIQIRNLEIGSRIQIKEI